jgi:FkbM family methyltransferase
MGFSEAYLKARNFVGRNKPGWMRCQSLRSARLFVDGLLLDHFVRYGKKAAVLRFKKGILKDQALVFPQPADFIDSIPNELPGYFALGNLIKPGGVVYDGGSWPGDFTVSASRLVGPKGKVYAFEPNPVHARYLREVLRSNECDNVVLVEKALARTTGRFNFHEEGAGSRLKSNGSINVKTISLDDFASSFGEPSFVKLDVEGAEIDIIRGAERTISRCLPNLAIASYHLINNQPTNVLLEKILREFYSDSKIITTYPRHLTTFALN